MDMVIFPTNVGRKIQHFPLGTSLVCASALVAGSLLDPNSIIPTASLVILLLIVGVFVEQALGISGTTAFLSSMLPAGLVFSYAFMKGEFPLTIGLLFSFLAAAGLFLSLFHRARVEIAIFWLFPVGRVDMTVSVRTFVAVLMVLNGVAFVALSPLIIPLVFFGFMMGFAFKKYHKLKYPILYVEEKKLIEVYNQSGSRDMKVEMAGEIFSWNWQNFEFLHQVLKDLKHGDKEQVLKINKQVRDNLVKVTALLIATKNHDQLARMLLDYSHVYELWMGTFFRGVNPKKVYRFGEACIESHHYEIAEKTFEYLRSLAPKKLDFRAIRKQLKLAQDKRESNVRSLPNR